jgi:hypothetical protein
MLGPCTPKVCPAIITTDVIALPEWLAILCDEQQLLLHFLLVRKIMEQSLA